MKDKLFTALALLISLNIFAQYDVDINKNKTFTEKEKRDKYIQEREVMGGCTFIPLHEYKVGMKFYFPKDEFNLKYDSYYTNYEEITQIKKNKFQSSWIGYKDIVGKLFEIVKIEDRGPSYLSKAFITLKQVDSSFIIEHKYTWSLKFLKSYWEEDDNDGQGFGLPDVVYTGEIDSFKEKYLNKEFYSTFLVDGKRFKKVKIVEVGAGSQNAPIRAIVVNEEGVKGQIDFCTCGTNVANAYLRSGTMDNYFLNENPKDTYKGREENWELICEQKIQIGFTEDELMLSWGAPNNINKTVVSGIKHEQFVYSSQYVYLENGIVTSFQSSDY